ncbi:TPA: antitoxin, partial [Escherichia coli]|nr:antitoxin [Escherichia coli]
MSKSYIVIQQYWWCNEKGHGVEYTTDGVDFDKRDKAIKHGLKTQGS